jgi:hypothetical protein
VKQGLGFDLKRVPAYCLMEREGSSRWPRKPLGLLYVLKIYFVNQGNDDGKLEFIMGYGIGIV